MNMSRAKIAFIAAISVGAVGAMAGLVAGNWSTAGFACSTAVVSIGSMYLLGTIEHLERRLGPSESNRT